MANANRAAPMADAVVVEHSVSDEQALGRTAVAFAGMLAARLGAQVFASIGGSACDDRGPMQAASKRFLGSAKQDRKPQPGELAQAWLLTDCPEDFDRWAGMRKILVRHAFGADGERPQSDLTLLAASGLLDIVGGPGRPPLPLPGHQLAYATGLAVFCALQAQRVAERRDGRCEPGQVAAFEVACWLNWKHRLNEVSDRRESGIERLEEWKVMRCRDGLITPIFLDNHMPALAQLTGSNRLLDPDFASPADRVRNLGELHGILEQALGGRTCADIMAQAARLGLPFAPVSTLPELMCDPQMLARRFFDPAAASTGPRLPVLWNGELLARDASLRVAGEAVA